MQEATTEAPTNGEKKPKKTKRVQKKSALRQAAAAEPRLIALGRKHDKIAKQFQEVQAARKALLATLSDEAKKLLNLGD